MNEIQPNPNKSNVNQIFKYSNVDESVYCWCRIVMVREMGDSNSALNMSRPAVNGSLVELVSRSLLPSSSYQLSAAELAETIKSRLKTLHGEWPSWTVRRPTTLPQEFQLETLYPMLTSTWI